MEKFVQCPGWENVEQAVATFVLQCPFYFDILSITGKRHKTHGFCCWYEVRYQMKDTFLNNWMYEAVEEEIESQKPLNTGEVDISFLGFYENGRWIEVWDCRYVVYCLDVQKCWCQERWEFENQGFREELKRIDDIDVMLKWETPVNYVEDFDNDSSDDDILEVEYFDEDHEDEGFYDQDDLFLVI